eukprot:jgi/Astpho2/3155/Aster-x1127
MEYGSQVVGQKRKDTWPPSSVPGNAFAFVPTPVDGTASTTTNEQHDRALKGSSSGQGSYSEDDHGGEDQPAPTEDSSEAQAAKREHAAEQRRLSKMDKAARMREKNKIAQKRWRERQKAKQCNGEKRQVELSTKLERMSLEKQTLQNRNAVLEKVLAMREQELSRARLGAVQQSQSPEVAHAQVPPEGPVAFDLQNGFNPEAVLRISVRGGLVLTAEAVKELPRDDVAHIWKSEKQVVPVMQDYVNQLAVLLLEAKGDPKSPVQAQIDQMVTEASLVCGCLAMASPVTIRGLHSTNIEAATMTPRGPGAPRWEAITRSLDIGEEQSKELLKCRNFYLNEMSKVVYERQKLLQTLHAMEDHQALCQHALGSDYVTLATALEQLQANIRTDHNLNCGAYPWFPDVMGITNSIAADAGAETASQIYAKVTRQLASESADTQADQIGQLVPQQA